MKTISKKKNILDSSLFHSSNAKLVCQLAAAFCAVVSIFLFIHIFVPVDYKDQSTILFSVEKGQGSWQITSSLKDAGLIRSSNSFILYAALSGRAFRFQSGDYLLSPSMNAHTIILTFVHGDIIKEYLTIKEGWNLNDIATEFENRGFFTQEEFFAVTGYPAQDYTEESNLPGPKDFSREFAFLKDKPLYISLEGYLFPDTYQVTVSETPESFVRRALKNFESNLTADILSAIKAQEKTIFEVINFAALLEKEVRSFQDKQVVSGILWKRLEDDMRLQADATVVYIREGNYYKVSIEETQIESPYNTYRVYGLPLGPISNPGLESIRAALEPKESPYWFYLSAPDGTTIFTKNFEEHKAAKERYLR
ncbi:MAG: endolytic transglycosylase MltG [Patescibacteria group bacterium]